MNEIETRADINQAGQMPHGSAPKGAFGYEASPNPDTVNDTGAATAQDQVPRNSFLSISEIGALSRSRTLRLQKDDAIVAIDAKPYHGDIDTFLDILFELENGKSVMLTIWRKGVIYNILVRGPLGCTLEYSKPEISEAINNDFKEADIGHPDDYAVFEVLRDIRRKTEIIDTRPSDLILFMPVIWLMQNRLWEALLAVTLIYGVTLSVHWVLFVISYILLSLYFKKAQVPLRRSFSLFKERQMWLIIAARSTREVQEICRKIDPKCDFIDSEVGPVVADAPPAKKRRRPRTSS
ncbi:hypothetical protein N9X12_00165 [Alphaproteobacteria bacterium]|nr:hypothetical protein [Alphaproteobacteria bacterium]